MYLMPTSMDAVETTPYRWISRDPLGENGGINLYDYVANIPIKYTDRLGLSGPQVGLPIQGNNGPQNPNQSDPAGEASNSADGAAGALTQASIWFEKGLQGSARKSAFAECGAHTLGGCKCCVVVMRGLYISETDQFVPFVGHGTLNNRKCSEIRDQPSLLPDPGAGQVYRIEYHDW